MLNTYNMSQSSILRLYDERDEIDFNPDYQRSGGIWSKYNRQLLIDSILNDFDIPKIYLHLLKGGEGYEYAVIDGKQRLQTVFEFIDGGFKLNNDFKLIGSDNVHAAGLNYKQLGQEYPRLKNRFDTHNLPVVVVETDEIDLIEDMFWRLNEASPLYAAEKRNAIGGYLVKNIRELSKNKFFEKCVRFGNKRQQHSEVSARVLYITHALHEYGRIYDTKKSLLDQFARDFKSKRKTYVTRLSAFVNEVLLDVAEGFAVSDRLLSSQSIIPIYFLAFIHMIVEGHTLDRNKLEGFHSKVDAAKKILSDADEPSEDTLNMNERDFLTEYELVRFSNLSSQGTNDAGSITQRVDILLTYLSVKPNWPGVVNFVRRNIANEANM